MKIDEVLQPISNLIFNNLTSLMIVKCSINFMGSKMVKGCAQGIPKYLFQKFQDKWNIEYDI
jgi:hypothetical protein